jgi:alkylation response protein AidB-like acyl-CoA dehydrogenase
MGIALTDDHRELAEVARGFLGSQKARAAARSLLDAPEEDRPPFWPALAELGWLGLHIDEEHGGSGYGLPELVVVIDELGRAVAPGPFVPTVIASSATASPTVMPASCWARAWVSCCWSWPVTTCW